MARTHTLVRIQERDVCSPDEESTVPPDLDRCSGKLFCADPRLEIIEIDDIKSAVGKNEAAIGRIELCQERRPIAVYARNVRARRCMDRPRGRHFKNRM